MSRIKADVTALFLRSQEIQDKIDELEKLNSELNKLIVEIGNSWEGKASDKYITTMQIHKEKSEKMILVLSEFKQYVENAAKKIELMDTDGASKIRCC